MKVVSRIPFDRDCTEFGWRTSRSVPIERIRIILKLSIRNRIRKKHFLDGIEMVTTSALEEVWSASLRQRRNRVGPR